MMLSMNCNVGKYNPMSKECGTMQCSCWAQSVGHSFGSLLPSSSLFRTGSKYGDMRLLKVYAAYCRIAAEKAPVLKPQLV